MENTQKKAVPNLKEVLTALGSLAVLEGKLAQRPVDEEFVQKLKYWSTGLFRIVVMGEIKKGKSSFINALLGVRDLVPVSSNVATSTIFKICYGEKIAYKVFFTKESQKPCILIDKDELALYGTEDGNPANEKQVDFIQVFVPSAFLKGGLVIIDTPGLGGLFKQHKRITYEYVPRADAVFLVSDSVESPIGKDELELLDDLRKVTDQIFFIQTKAMAVDAEAREVRARNNRQTLANHGFPAQTQKYFIVDSHLKLDADETKDRDDLVDSGFVPLAMFVNNEIKAKIHQHIIRAAITVARPKLEFLQNTLNNEEKLLAADNEASRKSLDEQLTQAESDATNWQRHQLPQLQDRLQDGLREIKARTGDQLRRFRPGGEIHEAVNQEIMGSADIERLFQILSLFSDKVANLYSECRYNILREIQSDLERLLRGLNDDKIDVGTDIVCSSPESAIIEVNTAPVTRTMQGNNPQNGSYFDKARTFMYGGFAGAGMAGIVGGVIGSVIPVVGTVIGSTLGVAIAGVFGGAAATQIKNASELEKAKQQALGAVAQTISSAYQNLTESIQRVLSDVESATMRSLRDAVSRHQEDIQRHLKDIQQLQSETVDQLNKRRQQLAASIREFGAIKAVVTRGV